MHLSTPPSPPQWSDDCKHAGGLVMNTHCAGGVSAFSNGDLRANCVCAERCRGCSSHTLALRLWLQWRIFQIFCKSNSLPATEAIVCCWNCFKSSIILLFAWTRVAVENKQLYFTLKHCYVSVVWGCHFLLMQLWCIEISIVIYAKAEGQLKEFMKI